MEEKMELILNTLSGLEERMSVMEKKIEDIYLTLDDEINKNIMVIAEGHTALRNRLDEALKVKSEREMLLIQVNRIENELRRVKNQIDRIEKGQAS